MAGRCFLPAGGGDGEGEGELRESRDKVEPVIVLADDEKDNEEWKQNTGLVDACARINFLSSFLGGIHRTRTLAAESKESTSDPAERINWVVEEKLNSDFNRNLHNFELRLMVITRDRICVGLTLSVSQFLSNVLLMYVYEYITSPHI